ncbi:chromosome segregation protein SMC [Peptostreptococcus faecalis]|uniref:chromosome segregation protein SMC n=1 Tax=Peptostreptococcus faecalis TaxID=2045015 RepID=UPI000C7AEE87|nr:chromosome segregation protein SMC [Peptostreptococcus faecalis]
MYLKKLELKGFKSFPTKTDILFEEGVTAVVGPNGSGKSNISDAIRWVLGEQSVKSLRGEKMEDVIFSGTDTKKHMNYCEVSLTLDNSLYEIDCDSNTLVIKRRAYRTGESEFFINGKSCRLKDVREILMDTGIGRDGYSVIEQGKVEDILSSNPANRRKIFDVACGIAKFRYKKNEAEKDLKKSSENLDRIIDIYSEIENQIKPLERQQKKAKKYIKLRDELKKIEINDFIIQHNDSENKIVDIKTQIENISKEMNLTENEKIILEKELSSLSEEVLSIEEIIEDLSENIVDINKNISENKKNLDVSLEKVKSKLKEIEMKKDDIISFEQNIESYNLELKKVNIKANDNSYEIEDIEKELGELFNQKKIAENNLENIEHDIEKSQGLSGVIADKKYSTSKNLAILQTDIVNMESRLNTLDKLILNYNEDLVNTDATIRENEERYLNVNKKIHEYESKLNNLSEEFKNIDSTLRSKKDELQSLANKESEIKTKKSTYIDMQNHHDGFNRGVREVLKLKKAGVYGALGELIKVDKKYEKAVEVALGAAIQNVVVKDESIAKELISYLKKNNLGRVTFLPLSSMKSKRNDFNINILKEYDAKFASEIVQIEDAYKNLIESLLGKVIVLENIDIAVEFANKTNHRYKIVTIEGDVLNPGGSMTGGSIKGNSNILSRNRIINELELELRNSINIIQRYELEIHEIENKKKNLKYDRDKIILEKSESEKKAVEISTEQKLIKTEKIRKQEEINRYQLEKKELDEKINRLKTDSDQNQKNIEELNSEIQENTQSIENLISNKKEIKNQFDEANKIYNEKNIQLAKIKQNFESTIVEIERIEKSITELQSKIKEIQTQINQRESEINSLDLEIENLKIEIKNDEKLHEENLIEVSDKKNQKDTLKEKLDEKGKELRLRERAYSEIKEELFKLESRLERYTSTKDNILSNLFDKYELTLVDAYEFRDETINIDYKKMEFLKKEIKEIGNVNLDSIKEYDEIKERYEYYGSQKMDLENSIISLNNLIEDLVENMEKEFIHKFSSINESFKKIYVNLFGGGSANLSLADESNILNCDIVITAQPPGKNMKNLSLLSGGEKALTAICILFAILTSKPTPFCILDEIEAPLDDVNVYRFGEFLKELSSQTQFIAVTHRRGTMEVADYIYGVTMQEKGISSVISLKLNEAKDMAEE